MINIRHLRAAPDDIEKHFDAVPVRTHALTLGSEALREAQVDLAHLDRITTTGRLTASLAPEVTQSIATIVTSCSGRSELSRSSTAGPGRGTTSARLHREGRLSSQ
jgi:hypothetical protein